MADNYTALVADGVTTVTFDSKDIGAGVQRVRHENQGAAATGAAVVGNPNLIGGKDTAGNVEPILLSTLGIPILGTNTTGADGATGGVGMVDSGGNTARSLIQQMWNGTSYDRFRSSLADNLTAGLGAALGDNRTPSDRGCLSTVGYGYAFDGTNWDRLLSGHGPAAGALRVELPTDGTGVVGIGTRTSKVVRTTLTPPAFTPGTLANGSSWQSASYTDAFGYDDFQVSMSFLVGSAVASPNVIQIYIALALDGTNFVYNASGSDATITLTTSPNFKLIGTVNCVTNSATEYFQLPSLKAVLGCVPVKFSFIVTNNTGQAFPANSDAITLIGISSTTS